MHKNAMGQLCDGRLCNLCTRCSNCKHQKPGSYKKHACNFDPPKPALPARKGRVAPV